LICELSMNCGSYDSPWWQRRQGSSWMR
jgi:hypothetical protein